MTCRFKKGQRVKFTPRGVKYFPLQKIKGKIFKTIPNERYGYVLDYDGGRYWGEFDDRYMVLVNAKNIIGGKLL